MKTVSIELTTDEIALLRQSVLVKSDQTEDLLSRESGWKDNPEAAQKLRDKITQLGAIYGKLLQASKPTEVPYRDWRLDASPD